MSEIGTVQLGSCVRVKDPEGEEEYTIVGDEDADALSNLISMDSPLGMALLGHAQGEHIKVRTPGGLRRVTILGIAVPATV